MPKDDTGQTVRIEALEQSLPPEPAPSPAPIPSPSAPHNGKWRVGHKVQAFLGHGAPVGTQHAMMLTATRSLLESGRTPEETATLVFQGLSRSPLGDPRWPWEYEDALAVAEKFAKTTPPPYSGVASSPPPTAPSGDEAATVYDGGPVTSLVDPMPDSISAATDFDPTPTVWWERLTPDPDAECISGDREALDALLVSGCGSLGNADNPFPKTPATPSHELPLMPGTDASVLRSRARYLFAPPKGITPSVVSRFLRSKANPTLLVRRIGISNAHSNPYNHAIHVQQFYEHFAPILTEDGDGVWTMTVLAGESSEQKRQNIQEQVKRRGDKKSAWCVWWNLSQAPESGSYVMFANREVKGSHRVPMEQVESELCKVFYLLPVPEADKGHKQKHFFTCTRNISMKREKDEGKFETVGLREGPPDDDHERDLAQRMGLTITAAESANPPLSEVGGRLIYKLRDDRVADLARVDADEAKREVLSFVQRCGYRLTVNAYREVYGQDPQWLADLNAARERKRGSKRAKG